MALEYQISEEAYEKLPESLQDHYVEADDGYQLEVDNVEAYDDGSELKQALKKEREERKVAKARAKELEDKLQEQQTEKKKKQEEFKELYEETQQKVQEQEGTISELQGRIEQGHVQAVAKAVAAGLTSDTRRAELLQEKAMEYLEYDADDGQVVIEVGGVPVDQKKLAEKLSEEYDFLVDGKEASGGGANGGAGGQGSFNLDEMTEEEAREKFHNDPAFREHVQNQTRS